MSRKLLFILVFIFLSLSAVSAQQLFSSSYSSASFITRQTSSPSFQTYYSSEGRLGTYWPILNNPSECEARQDVMIQIAPGGCQPVVVRSDLLAEQNVPVFCQLDALKINPLLDIREIRSIRFTGKYPKEVTGTGFHPARAALRTRDALLGDPLINNIGYVVVVLRQTPNETSLPNSVKVNLQANIQYESVNSLGIGRADFFLSEQSDEEWQNEKDRQSFWNGKYFVRLDALDANGAVVSIYSGDRKIGTTRVGQGQTSRDIYVPGSYCQAAVNIDFAGFQKSAQSARIEVGNGNSTDVLDVYKGSRFLDGKCEVLDLKIDNVTRTTGSVSIRCPSGKIELSLMQRGIGTFDVFNRTGMSLIPDSSDGVYTIDYGITHRQYKGKYGLTADNNFVIYDANGNTQIATSRNTGMAQEFLDSVRLGLFEYKRQQLSGTNSEPKVLQERIYGGNADLNFTEAILAYEEIAKEYPREQIPTQGESPFGQQGLINAINFAREAGKEATRARLLQLFIDTYPNVEETNVFRRELSTMYSKDSSLSATIIELDNRYRSIRLVSLKDPLQKASAEFSYGSDNVNVQINQKYEISSAPIAGSASKQKPYIEFTEYNVENVLLRTNCNDVSRSVSTGGGIRMNLGESVQVCGRPLVLKKINAEQIAHIRLVPKARATQTEANLTVNIGIEKRALSLTPEKTKERVSNLNKSIATWDKLSNNLGGVVSGLQAACFATSAVLTAKNFIYGLSGEALARQDAMKYWKGYCRDAVANGNYTSQDACYLEKSSEIEGDVKQRTEDIKVINDNIKAVQENEIISSDLVSGKTINTKASAKALANEVVRKYGNVKIKMPEGQKWVKPGSMDGSDEVLVKELLNESAIDSGLIGNAEIRQIYTDLEGRSSGFSQVMQKGIGESLSLSANKIKDNLQDDYQYKLAQSSLSNGLPQVSYPEQYKGGTIASVVSKNLVSASKNIDDSALRNIGKSFDSEFSNADYVSRIRIDRQKSLKEAGIVPINPGIYLVGLKKIDSESYEVVKAYKIDNNVGEKAILGAEANNLGQYLGIVTASEQISYQNTIRKPEIKYFETEPYKGMPAIVPFDTKNGWYVATKQTLPAYGGIGAYDSSGRISSFWLCNVGKNGLVDFDVGFEDDICRQFTMNTGQPLNKFSGLSDAQAQRLVDKAVSALQEAARQYQDKNSFVSIGGSRIPVGKPATNKPETECQDFMSPTDCHILFNVCDPVICPPTRCDFGGKYPVADVIQSGIIGSTLLCLPNINEGIYVPVCLSGIKAGIDGYVSVLKAHRDCLQESLNTGKMIGICDQIYSVYSCEFFWRQLSPLTKILVPKLFEIAQGQGTRGGGEYLTVAGAWQNTRKSIDYFTQVYGVNTFKAFQVRSVEEAGGEFCKGFISAKAPTSFKSLIEPASPVQFHAYFSSTKYSDATVPATAQYKVFYHIYAGKDSSIFYRVYLKNPPESSYYASTPILQIATGYIGRGKYKDETRDFTAPEGYQELCVNLNGEEKCGFKQVTSSAALNYIRDEFVSGQIKENDITSESECVSGSVNAAALLNPNIQQGAEEAINPEIYRRGIIRICATNNPGSSTDPTRFVEVGFCGDTKVRCWLDKKSVDNAITDNNKGVRNETLKALTQTQVDNLISDAKILNDKDAQAALTDVSGAVKELSSKGVISDMVKASSLLKRIDTLFNLLYFNHQKAHLMFLKAQVKEGIAKSVLAEQVAGKLSGSISQSANGSEEIKREATWNLDSALIEINQRIYDKKTSFSDNKDFYSALLADKIITKSEYETLTGEGLFSFSKDITELRKILLVKQQVAQRANIASSASSLPFQSAFVVIKDVWQSNAEEVTTICNGFFVVLKDGTLGVVTNAHCVNNLNTLEVSKDGSFSDSVSITGILYRGDTFTVETFRKISDFTSTDYKEDYALLSTSLKAGERHTLVLGDSSLVNKDSKGYLTGYSPENLRFVSFHKLSSKVTNPNGYKEIVQYVRLDNGVLGESGMSGSAFLNEKDEVIGLVFAVMVEANDQKTSTFFSVKSGRLRELTGDYISDSISKGA